MARELETGRAVLHLSPKAMYQASRSLIGGAKIIIDSEGIHDRGMAKIPTLPVIICCALAIEIGIKAFLVLEAKPFPTEGSGHSLKALFEALSVPIQRDLLSFQVRFTGSACLIRPSSIEIRVFSKIYLSTGSFLI